jgi:uncharacterized protein with NAD-binding domain and iron-sulfur cluster
MEQAWSPLTSVVLYDHYNRKWSHVYRPYDIEPGLPWDAPEVPRFWDFVLDVLHQVEGHIGFMKGASKGHLSSSRIGPVANVTRRVGDVVERAMVGTAGWVADRHHRRGATHRRHAHPVAWLLARIRDHVWRTHVRGHLDNDAIRHRFSQLDMSITCMIGMIRDEVLWKGFDTINDLDFREWLKKHGVKPPTLDGPDVRVTYDEAFADSIGRATTAKHPPKGNREDAGLFAAGAALYLLIRTQLPYRGSVMWQATAGMGDTAVEPMYETLVKRGVEIKFFQNVEHLAVDRERMIVERIDVVQQATPIGDYEPLVDVKGLSCWPSTPKWDLLENGEQLAASHIDFELGQAQPNAPVEHLHLGRDFDKVVLAISVAALPPICRDVSEVSPRFKAMLDHSHTIMTQAFQLWLREKPVDLGFPYGHTATSSFVEPVDTAADNSQLLWSEDWPDGDAPAAVWYFCGTLDDYEGEDQASAKAKAKAGALGYLRHIGDQWPGAVHPVERAGQTMDEEFRWDLLFALSDEHGEDRFDTQYWRGNFAPTERYVQTLPGTVQYRLRADESGVHNLLLAGDWTRNGVDVGAVETTVMSGMLAAQAISGSPAHIPWLGHAWLVGE